MATLPRPRAVRVLGHPIAGLAPILFLSAGWLLLALQIVPYMRDSFAGGAPRGRASELLRCLAAAAADAPHAGRHGRPAGDRTRDGHHLDQERRRIRPAERRAPLPRRVAGRHRPDRIRRPHGGLLAHGDPSLEDTKTHIVRGWLWFDSFHAGTLPRWTDLWYGGTPADQHYPPLAHIFQGLLGFLRFGPFTAAKALAWICRVAGAIGFALLCARIHKDQRAGLAGRRPVRHLARDPLRLDLGGTPPGRAASRDRSLGIPGDRADRDRHRGGAGRVRARLAIGGMVLAHAATRAFPSRCWFSFLLVRAIPTLATRGSRAPSVAGLLIGLIGGAALAASFLVPVLREAAYVNGIAQRSLTGFTFGLPHVSQIIDALPLDADGEGIHRDHGDRPGDRGDRPGRSGPPRRGAGYRTDPARLLAFLPFYLSNPEKRGLDFLASG